MPAELLKRARDKFVDVMDAGERTAIGLNERAKRLKQAMFPEGPQESPYANKEAGPMPDTKQPWESPSRAGEHSYQPSETKKARKSRR
jgi:hypothetical protein